MVQRGTVVNGVIVQIGSPPPDGTHVVFEPSEVYEYPHPMAPYDREKEAALLQQSIAEMDAGIPGLTVDEVMKKLDAELLRLAERTEN